MIILLFENFTIPRLRVVLGVRNDKKKIIQTLINLTSLINNFAPGKKYESYEITSSCVLSHNWKPSHVYYRKSLRMVVALVAIKPKGTFNTM